MQLGRLAQAEEAYTQALAALGEPESEGRELGGAGPLHATDKSALLEASTTRERLLRSYGEWLRGQGREAEGGALEAEADALRAAMDARRRS